MIGIVNEPSSPRFAKKEFNKMIRTKVSRQVVSVAINHDNLDLKADLIQVHRILNDDELERLETMSTSRFILYVPVSEEGRIYLRKVVSHGFDKVLFDSPRRGLRTSLQLAKELLDVFPDAGLAGGINPENVVDFVSLNPGWLDVSSGVEEYPGKKSRDKVMKIKEVIKGGV
jgi:phosphoribosylanthranilate isomerase